MGVGEESKKKKAQPFLSSFNTSSREEAASPKAKRIS